eukprot:10857542-Karenia_brevis.AAC.1
MDIARSFGSDDHDVFSPQDVASVTQMSDESDDDTTAGQADVPVRVPMGAVVRRREEPRTPER